MGATSHYPIRGGLPGRERLRVVSRVLRPSTLALLQRAGARPGMNCLDVGCGGGDVAFDLARLVLPGGHVAGTDIDDTKLAIARAEAVEQHLHNVTFLHADALTDIPDGAFDLVHARFLLSHLGDPAAAIANMRRSLKPGGTLVLEDVDFTGYFCHPPFDAFERYKELYTQAARRRGADPALGRRLPELAREAGFTGIHMNVVQHAGLAGDVKFVSALTMEAIADAVVAAGLAERDETDRLTAALFDFAGQPHTICASPRIFEVWATAPSGT